MKIAFIILYVDELIEFQICEYLLKNISSALQSSKDLFEIKLK